MLNLLVARFVGWGQEKVHIHGPLPSVLGKEDAWSEHVSGLVY